MAGLEPANQSASVRETNRRFFACVHARMKTRISIMIVSSQQRDEYVTISRTLLRNPDFEGGGDR
jgi:hypothetical protein